MTAHPVELHKRKSFTPKQRAEVFEAKEGWCRVCGLPITHGQKWDVEHRVPLALGGSNEIENLEPVHAGACHRSKTDADLARIAKAKRLAGETCAGPTKRPLKSRPDAWGPGTRKLAHPSLKRTFAGRVVPRKAKP